METPTRAEMREQLSAKYPDIGRSLVAHRNAQKVSALRRDRLDSGDTPSLDDIARSLGRSAVGLERAVRALHQREPVMPPQPPPVAPERLAAVSGAPIYERAEYQGVES